MRLLPALPLNGQAQVADQKAASDNGPIQLSPFAVNTRSNDGYVSNQATASGRLVQSRQEGGQNVTVVNAVQIAPLSAPEALHYVAGISGNNDERHSNTFALCGLPVMGARRNGEYTNASWSTPEAVEQYEVVRGASAVRYGSSQPGGAVSYVTKSPQFRAAGEITTGGFGLSHTGAGELAADLTGPVKKGLTTDLDAPSTLADRLMLIGEDREDYRGPGFDYSKRQGVFGKVTWKPFAGRQIQSEYECRGLRQFKGSALLVPGTSAGTPADKVALPDAYGISVSWTFRDASSMYRRVERFWETSISSPKGFGKWGKWTARSFLSLNDRYVRIAGPSGSAQPRPVTVADIGEFSEAGPLFPLEGNKVRLDLTYFVIKSTNVLPVDASAAVNDSDPTPRYRFIAGTTRRGADVDVTFNWGKAFQPVFAHSDQDVSAAPIPAQLQATPTQSSVLQLNVARHSATVLTWWEPRLDRLPSLWLTLGVRYTDKKPASLAGALSSYFIPGDAIFDLGAGYTFDRPWVVDVNVKNILDKYAYRDSPNAVIIVAERPRPASATLHNPF